MTAELSPRVCIPLLGLQGLGTAEPALGSLWGGVLPGRGRRWGLWQAGRAEGQMGGLCAPSGCRGALNVLGQTGPGGPEGELVAAPFGGWNQGG